MLKISLIPITYNNPKFLKRILDSIRLQKVLPFEVIIADDGSTNETRELILEEQKDFPVPIKHYWHEDKGFRISKVRNGAIKLATGDYIIFTDGDLILDQHFISDYRNYAKKGLALIGCRLFLSKEYSEKLVNNPDIPCANTPFGSQVEKNPFNGIRLPFVHRITQIHRKPNIKMRGGLLGIYKEDIVNVNGWDEIYEGWGKEDTDLLIRLIHNGIAMKKFKYKAPTFHLWHPIASRDLLKQNEDLLLECINSRRIKAIKGLNLL